MRAVALLLLVLCLAAPLWASPQDADFFSASHLQKLGGELMPLIERETGHRFHHPVPIQTCTSEEMVDLLTQELEPQMTILHLHRADAHEAAQDLTPNLLGKYTVHGDRVMIPAANFDSMMDLFILQGSVDPRLLLRVVLVHELVHAQDEQLYHAVTHVDSLRTSDQLKVWNALLEGHAQSVTHRIFTRLHQEKLFLAFVQRVLPAPAKGSPKAFIAAYHTLAFSYVDGMRFFDALHKPNTRDEAGAIFAHPPASADAIEHPKAYRIVRTR